MLLPSQKVPTLSFDILGHGEFDLGRDHGDNGTLLIVYRGLHCPICIRQMTELETTLVQFSELGVEVAMISADGQDRAQHAADKAGVQNLRIGYGLSLKSARDDWGLYLSSARDGTQEPALFPEPGHFYIAPDNTLYVSWVQSAPFARPALSDIAGAIRFCLDKKYPPRGTYTGPLPGDT